MTTILKRLQITGAGWSVSTYSILQICGKELFERSDLETDELTHIDIGTIINRRYKAGHSFLTSAAAHVHLRLPTTPRKKLNLRWRRSPF
jgi:hypothetical protein